MKKVFIVHGFNGEPNGGWRPWLMGELAKKDVYSCFRIFRKNILK